MEVTCPGLPSDATSLTITRGSGPFPGTTIATGKGGGDVITDSGLTASSSYSYGITAVGADGSTVGGMTMVTLPPSTGTWLLVSGITPSSIQITLPNTLWNNASSLVLERCQNEYFTPANEVYTVGGGGTNANCSITGLSANEGWFYRAKANGSPGSVSFFASSSGRPGGAIQPLFGKVGPTSLTVELPALPAEASSFSIERSTSSGFTAGTVTTVATGKGANSTFDDTGLNPSTTYYYRAVAVNSYGSTNGAYNSVATTNGLAAGPNAPALAKVAATTLTVELAALPAEADSLSIQRSTSSNFSPAGTVTTVATGLAGGDSFDDSGLSPNTTYYYRAVAVNTYGGAPGTSSTVATTSGLSSAPNIPAIANIGPNTLTVELPTALPAEASSFSIQRSTSSSFSPAGTVTTVATGLGAGATFDDSGLTPSTTYYYRAVAVNSFGGTNGGSITVTTATGLATAPNVPLIAKIGPNTLTVEVPAQPAEASTLSIQRSTSSGFSPAGTVTTIASGIGGDTTFDDTGLTANTTYYYRIVAVNSFGSTNGTAATVVTATGLSTAPNAPAIANIGTSTLTVELAALPVEADSLSLQRSTASNFSPATTIATGLAGNAKYDDSGLTPNTTYYYRAVAVNSFGSVNGASIQTATWDGRAPAPNAPSLGKVGPNTLTVELPALPTEADSLSIQRSTASNFSPATTIATGLAGNAKYDDSGLTPNTTYYYRAIAVNTFGSTNGASASVTTTNGLSAAPNVPLFGLVRSTTLTVTPPALPAEAASLTLQRSTTSNFASPTNLITGLTTGANYDDSGLTANTLYYYRALAVNSFGSVVGTSATVTTLPVLPKTWTVGSPIGEDYDSNGDTTYNGRMISPQDQRTDPATPANTIVGPGKMVLCEVETATDLDDWTSSIYSGDEKDTVSYVWTCSGGGFVDGNGDLQTTMAGRTATWKAPDDLGPYSLSCTINDLPIAVTSPDIGNRDDSTLVRTADVLVTGVTNVYPDPEVDAEIMSGAIDNEDHKIIVYAQLSSPLAGVTVHFEVEDSSESTMPASISVIDAVTDSTGIAQTVLKSSNTSEPNKSVKIKAYVRDGNASDLKDTSVALLLPDIEYDEPD